MRAVVKLGGALFRREPNVTALKDMGKVLSGFVKEGNQLVLVAGGGENARTYIGVARRLGAEESTCDLLGIQITRANAELLRLAMGSVASSKIPTTLSDLPHCVGPGKAVVMGGLQPGQSTNAVAALAAEITRAEILVNGTDVDGVYTENPKKNPKAKLIHSVNVEKLLTWAMEGEVFAGRYELLDPLAIKIMQRAKIPTRFVSLADPSNILAALLGKDVGTRVVYS
ncbi:MAG TPA: UMP kinase [Candidatus Sulfotelmatobacter sp.]|jgi:uridylate kinase|nr:UMP kinase [Candidatus Sulfotelmatobacter sp.]